MQVKLDQEELSQAVIEFALKKIEKGCAPQTEDVVFEVVDENGNDTPYESIEVFIDVG